MRDAGAALSFASEDKLTSEAAGARTARFDALLGLERPHGNVIESEEDAEGRMTPQYRSKDVNESAGVSPLRDIHGRSPRAFCKSAIPASHPRHQALGRSFVARVSGNVRLHPTPSLHAILRVRRA